MKILLLRKNLKYVLVVIIVTPGFAACKKEDAKPSANSVAACGQVKYGIMKHPVKKDFIL